MPELAAIKTPYFECVIWVKELDASQRQLCRTMAQRNKPVPESVIQFNPAVQLFDSHIKLSEYACDEALFFENKQYDIEFIFDKSLKPSFLENHPKVMHRLKSIEDAFHYSERSHALRATINTGNDIGWFSIELHYPVNNKNNIQTVSFEVLPTKIDMTSDLKQMNRLIDKQYPLWRFKLAEKTQQNVSSVKQPYAPFLLLWLAQFERLRLELEKGLKHIVNAPHSRLVKIVRPLKAEKLKGKLNPKLEISVRQAQYNGLSNKRFNVEKKQLSIDTPENRFIKAVLKVSVRKLTDIKRIANQKEKLLDKQRLSDSFFQQLDSWQASLRKYQNHTMFQEVGDYTGLSRESLVLQQKPGYAKVYKVWQQLKWYLDFLGNDASLSLRNVAELYEVWCFLEIKNILIELGFKEKQHKKALLNNQGLEVTMKDGLAGAFEFNREDGITLKLLHEREFKRNSSSIKTWTTAQKPDILLEATIPGSDGDTQIIWLFDAKYRIEKNKTPDLVPDDAINQLHRYRDALIQLRGVTPELSEKTRPVFGAYALYPGYYDQQKELNPYNQSNEEVGIGAFSFLPSSDGAGSIWLKSFLKEKLGAEMLVYNKPETDRYYVEESSRISYHGMKQFRYEDLTLVVTGAPAGGRDKDYLQRFVDGTAGYYHMQLHATERDNIEMHVIHEIKYCAITTYDKESGERVCQYLWPVRSISLVSRNELTIEQAGRLSASEDDYWLFELGKPFSLSQKIRGFPPRRHYIKLVLASELDNKSDYSSLEPVYKNVLI
ncbi:MAG: DUF2357 domain-containing protein [Methylococcales bacterium]